MDQLKISQNFLHSVDTTRKIISISNLCKEDVIYEIGPGKGIITKELSQVCNSVVAIELDSNLVKKIRTEFAQYKNISIYEANFLKYELPFEGDYKIFSNIPFNITAEIIQKITDNDNPPIDSYLIVQKEAAIKYSGNPYSRETFRSLLIKPWFNTTIIYTFDRADFRPIPNADIVLLRISRRKEPFYDVENFKKYKDFIAYAFMNNSANIKSCFKDIITYEQLKRLAKKNGFDMKSNINTLSDSNWISLFNFFLEFVDLKKQGIIFDCYIKLIKQQASLEKRHRNNGK